MKKYLLVLILPLLFTCQRVPECQKHSTSDLTMRNQTGVKLEVMLQMREPDGDHHYGKRMVDIDSKTTYKGVKQGHIRISARIDGTDHWFYKDTYNVRCQDHDFVWRWDIKTGIYLE